MKVAPGDRFFMYSDGLVENLADGAIWTSHLDALLDCVNDIKTSDLVDSVYFIKKKFFPNRQEPEDDIVIMGVEV